MVLIIMLVPTSFVSDQFPALSHFLGHRLQHLKVEHLCWIWNSDVCNNKYHYIVVIVYVNHQARFEAINVI